jgi:hypothetical protein
MTKSLKATDARTVHCEVLPDAVSGREPKQGTKSSPRSPGETSAESGREAARRVGESVDSSASFGRKCWKGRRCWHTDVVQHADGFSCKKCGRFFADESSGRGNATLTGGKNRQKEAHE